MAFILAVLRPSFWRYLFFLYNFLYTPSHLPILQIAEEHKIVQDLANWGYGAQLVLACIVWMYRMLVKIILEVSVLIWLLVSGSNILTTELDA